VSGSVAESVQASKTRFGAQQALELARKADRVIAVRGKKVVEFDMKADPPDDETLLAHLLGPTGNLRAPTAMVGRTLVVGFNEETYKQVLGA
jgi:arsenate reductase-like glutaredoxin family protein